MAKSGHPEPHYLFAWKLRARKRSTPREGTTSTIVRRFFKPGDMVGKSFSDLKKSIIVIEICVHHLLSINE
jgi:hypothetical protein